ncbi:MAG TPA: PVC-type heme-binding CxxCH protein [Planctomycetota bacterium]|nr:PVC-type heme-binding CxxCH protein [Planctomycetota bacterium]
MNATRILERPITWSSRAAGLLVACLPSHAQEGGVPGDGAAPADQAPRSRSATEEQAGFTLAEGFTAELVASEPVMDKIVDIAFDDHGRMWAVTAREYPLDGNETPGAAAVYERGGRDKVLVFDSPWAPGLQTPRVFADGFVIPLAILPEGDSVLIGQGPDILRLFDDDGDGRADRREVVLTGFGIQDSHLLPHRFVRASGGWIYVAQGAFNSSRVRTRSGTVVPFDKCKIGRFQRDGSRFEVVGVGLNNIWGFVVDRQGDKWIQEANDLGYPLVPFEHGASYPGIGNHRARPHSPWRPALASFRMGGTGLAGLALSQDRDGFPPPWDETFFLANPILSSIQSLRATRSTENHGEVSLQRVEDLLTSEDKYFRPVAIHFGPDGCLYVVDWYNPIISHNEVPRDHPDRDKVRSRIWRIRHASQERATPTDVGALAEGELVDLLSSPSTWTARAAWHQIADRQAVGLAGALGGLAADAGARVDARVLALWALEDIERLEGTLLEQLARSAEPALRREAARLVAPLAAHLGEDSARMAQRLAWSAGEADPRVRFAAIEALGACSALGTEAAALLLGLARDADDPRPGPALADDVAFERSLIRVALEGDAGAVVELLEGAALSERARDLALVCLEGRDGARFVARDLLRSQRAPSAEEFAMLAPHGDDASVLAAIEAWLSVSVGRDRALSIVLDGAERRDLAHLGPIVVESLRALQSQAPGPESERLLLRGARVLRLTALEEDVLAILDGGGQGVLPCLEALVELGCTDAGLFFDLAVSSVPGGRARRLAATALAEVAGDEDYGLVLELWPLLERRTRRATLAALLTRREGALRIVRSLKEGDLPIEIVDGPTLEQLVAHLGDEPDLTAVRERVTAGQTPILRMNGGGTDFADSDLAIAGPFTVEAWVRFEEPLTNADGVLCGTGTFDLNFHAARPRLWCGPGLGDVIIAGRPVRPDTWTHVALTRDAAGVLCLYLDGELDQTSTASTPERFEGLDVGRTTPGAGTAGALAEFRLWDRARTAAEIGASFRLRLRADTQRVEGPSLILPGAEVALSGSARIEGSSDGPPAQTREAARAEAERLGRFRTLAAAEGDETRGEALFAQLCSACHLVGGVGTSIGPVLDGVAAKGREGLLRSILTPSAGVEGGYRTLVVRMADGRLLTGFLAEEETDALLLRRQDRPDLRVRRSEIESLRYDSLSLMPEGLLDELEPQQVSDLFRYLGTLR